MAITVNQDMLNQIVDDVDDRWASDITFSMNVSAGSYGDLFESDLNTIKLSETEQRAMVVIGGLWDDLIGYNIDFFLNNDDEDMIINQTNGLPTGIGGRTYSTLHGG